MWRADLHSPSILLSFGLSHNFEDLSVTGCLTMPHNARHQKPRQQEPKLIPTLLYVGLHHNWPVRIRADLRRASKMNECSSRKVAAVRGVEEGLAAVHATRGQITNFGDRHIKHIQFLLVLRLLHFSCELRA